MSNKLHKVSCLASKWNGEQGTRGTLNPAYYLFITLAYIELAEHHYSMFHMAMTPPEICRSTHTVDH